MFNYAYFIHNSEYLPGSSLSVHSSPINSKEMFSGSEINLYVLDKTIKLDDIEVIASHPQAIKQCEKYIEKTFNKAKIINSPDTAYAAKALANGAYTKNTAVLCRKDAGEKNGLYKLAKHVEDRIDNRTEFHLYKDV